MDRQEPQCVISCTCGVTSQLFLSDFVPDKSVVWSITAHVNEWRSNDLISVVTLLRTIRWLETESFFLIYIMLTWDVIIGLWAVSVMQWWLAVDVRVHCSPDLLYVSFWPYECLYVDYVYYGC